MGSSERPGHHCGNYADRCWAYILPGTCSWAGYYSIIRVAVLCSLTMAASV